MGIYRTTFLAQSLDEKLRNTSASGGAISALLIFALEAGLIDGALVVRMSKQHPLKPEVFIARTEKGILSGSQSKYLPVPMNVGIQEILKRDGRYAVVGLPCHIHGIRKTEILFPKPQNRIAFLLGLFWCAWRPFRYDPIFNLEEQE